MTTSLISLAGVLAAAGISAAVAIRQAQQNAALQVALARLGKDTQTDLARLNSDLETEVAKRTALMERDLRAEEVLKRYREPLAAAAFDLQSRLYNILRLEFFATFGGDHERCALAETTTLFRYAQYFGWTEILRRDIQFLSFPEAEDTKGVIGLQLAISKRLNTSRDHEVLMIWSDEQRAIGERMIVEEFGKVQCMGYARFSDEYADRFDAWCARLRTDLQSEAGHDRIRDVQHLLCSLVRTLDPARVRYTQDLELA